VGSEVLAIARDVVETFGDVAGLRAEIARRVASSDFLSTKGLEEIRKIDEREAKWLKKLGER
jgi:VIT1/CCC1 family predicted Fe2+/Mn2+ transporter